MSSFDSEPSAFEDAGATVYGSSVDAPPSRSGSSEGGTVWASPVSDSNTEPTDASDVSMDVEDVGYERVARRAVSVVDTDGETAHGWMADDCGTERATVRAGRHRLRRPTVGRFVGRRGSNPEARPCQSAC